MQIHYYAENLLWCVIKTHGSVLKYSRILILTGRNKNLQKLFIYVC